MNEVRADIGTDAAMRATLRGTSVQRAFAQAFLLRCTCECWNCIPPTMSAYKHKKKPTGCDAQLEGTQIGREVVRERTFIYLFIYLFIIEIVHKVHEKKEKRENNAQI